MHGSVDRYASSVGAHKLVIHPLHLGGITIEKNAPILCHYCLIRLMGSEP